MEIVRPKVITMWDGSELVLLDHKTIDGLPEDDKQRYLTKLHEHQLDMGREASPWYSAWRKWDERCREDDCTGTRYEGQRFCVRHLDLDAIDPDGAIKRKSLRTRMRLAELMEKAVDDFETMLGLGMDELPAAVRVKILENVLDRGGAPRHTAASMQIDSEVTVTHMDAGQIIMERLDRLAGSVVMGELAGIEEATERALGKSDGEAS
jgi:hypothetical protein